MGRQTENSDELKTLLAAVLSELAATRSRLDNFRREDRGGSFALKAAALSQEVEQCCRAAALAEDSAESRVILKQAQAALHGLQVLIGVH